MTAPDYFDGRLFTALRAFVAAERDAVFCGCTFKECNFQGADLASFSFEDCVFADCNLSLIQVAGTAFKGVKFERCKMEGINFFDCCRTVLSMRFLQCDLRCASFAGLPLKRTDFTDCSVREAVFSKADLSGSSFTRCDLARAVFQQTNLEKTDFTTAYNFVFDPESNRMRKARFSVYGLPGLLEKYGLEIE